MSVDTGGDAGPGNRTGGGILVLAGIALTLIGALGDAIVHALNPSGHSHEPLITLGSGTNPWHWVLFVGIVVTAVGGIRWAGRLRSDWAALMGAGLTLLLIATLGAGAWLAWEEDHLGSGTGTGAPTGLAVAGAAHVHGTQADTSGTSTSATSGLGEGAEGTSFFGAHSHGEPGPVSPAEQRILDGQLADARAATWKYHNFARAKREGYIQVTQFIPGLGLHMVNLAISEQVFDPRQPQMLLYEPTPGGHFRLVGIGYVLRTSSDTPPEGFAGGSDVWHFHQNLCFLPGGSVTIAPSGGQCVARGGLFQDRSPWLLHVWLWQNNPSGIFTEANPLVF